MYDFLTTAFYEPYLFIALLYAGLAIAIVYNDIICFEIDILAVCAAALCVTSLFSTNWFKTSDFSRKRIKLCAEGAQNH